MDSPGLVGLYLPEGPVEIVNGHGQGRCRFRFAQGIGDKPQHLAVFCGFCFAEDEFVERGESERACGSRACISHKHRPDPLIGADILRKPAEGVETRGQRHRPLEGNPAMGGAQADQAAEARRSADRPARIRTGSDIAEPARHGCGRARGRTAGDPVGRRGVDRMGIVDVLSHEGEGEFVGLCLADESRPCIEHCLDGRRRFGRDGLLDPSLRIAASGRVTGHVEDVLHAQSEPGERAVGRRGDRDFGIVEEGVQPVFRAGHCSIL